VTHVKYASVVGRSFALALASIVVVAAAAAEESSQTSPWTAIASKRYTADTYGKFEGDKQKTGSYVEWIRVYALDDGDYDKGDWYRIDMSVESAISSYRDGSSTCGWFTDRVTAAFALLTSNGDIQDFGPQADGGGGYSLGSSVYSQGPFGGASYSMTQEVADSGITVDSSTTKGTIVWTAKLRGCKPKSGTTGQEIGFTGASKIAKSSYILNPSVIVKVPEGTKLNFKTQVGDKGANGLRHGKSKLRSGGFKSAATRKATYLFIYDITCTTTSYSFSRKVDYSTD